MKIGIDGGCLANRRGFGRFARQVLSALAEVESHHDFVVFVDRPSADAVEIPDGFRRIIVDVREAPSLAASSQGRRGARDLLAMGRAVARERPDLVYFPATYSFFPVWNCGRIVVTLHDTLALAHPDLVFPRWQGRLAWALKEYAAVARADRVLTVSEASKRDLCAWFRLRADRVGVVLEAPDEVFRPLPRATTADEILARYRLDDPAGFLIYVGGLSPHKNLPRLIEAFAAADLPGTNLVLVGDHGDVFHTHLPELRAVMARLGVEDRVKLPGFVPDADLVFLYNRALALVQPSLMEGFGLPPVEAMACGTPILSSRAGSLPEVIGDAGIYFEPTDVAAMAGALRRVVLEPAERDRRSALSLRRAGRFRKADVALALLDAFDRFDPARSRRIA